MSQDIFESIVHKKDGVSSSLVVPPLSQVDSAIVEAHSQLLSPSGEEMTVGCEDGNDIGVHVSTSTPQNTETSDTAASHDDEHIEKQKAHGKGKLISVKNANHKTT